MIASHPAVSTASEPWLLLPLLYTRSSSGVHAEYRHRLAVDAIAQFSSNLSGGIGFFETALHDLVITLYTEASEEGSSYFLDKTPRYHLIADQIADLFPEAKFIFLWRNPVSVLSSIIRTWGGGKWNLHNYFVDLRIGLPNLVRAAERGDSRAIEIRYEDLVTDPDATMKRVGDLLELEFDESIWKQYAKVPLTGSLGDQQGIRQYSSVSSESIDNWLPAVSNLTRRWWTRNYLKQLGADALDRMGYPLADVLAQVAASPSRLQGSIGDLARVWYARVHWRVDRLILEHRVTAGLRRFGRS